MLIVIVAIVIDMLLLAGVIVWLMADEERERNEK